MTRVATSCGWRPYSSSATVPPHDRPAMCAGPRTIDRLDQRCQHVGEVGQAEALRKVGRPPTPWLVPGHDGEGVGQADQLRLPDAAVVAGAVQEDQRRSPADQRRS